MSKDKYEKDEMHVDEPELCLDCGGDEFYVNRGVKTRLGFKCEYYCKKCKSKFKLIEPYVHYQNTGHIFKLKQVEMDKMRKMVENGWEP